VRNHFSRHLSEEVVEFIDANVAAGRAKSRAEVVTRLFERNRRRERALRDVELVPADRSIDFNDLASAVAGTALDLD
jgi:Arc/MetJ-type ribon-helix-helix transcriptional regulator